MTEKKCKAMTKNGVRCCHRAMIGDLCLPHFLVEYDGGKIKRIGDDDEEEGDT